MHAGVTCGGKHHGNMKTLLGKTQHAGHPVPPTDPETCIRIAMEPLIPWWLTNDQGENQIVTNALVQNSGGTGGVKVEVKVWEWKSSLTRQGHIISAGAPNWTLQPVAPGAHGTGRGRGGRPALWVGAWSCSWPSQSGQGQVWCP